MISYRTAAAMIPLCGEPAVNHIGENPRFGFCSAVLGVTSLLSNSLQWRNQRLSHFGACPVRGCGALLSLPREGQSS